jgi:exopolyphosphatase / guanosine-5'-triphosphate,3'-diphosphate pyrophosphatase
MKLASIDIGSNAVRLLLVNVYEGKNGPSFKKADLVRVPLRLGDDAFRAKKISREKIDKLLLVMKSFRALIDFYEVDGLRAAATSAMRDATNGTEITALIKKETGIAIEIIDGKTEAQIIFANHIAEELDQDHDYIYIDVGGGSTELTLFSKSQVVTSRSFNIGTIRMLNDLVSKELWTSFKDWIKETTRDHKRPLMAIGSGGNINKLFKMSRFKHGQPLSLDKLKELHEMLEGYTLDERMRTLGLNPDRADVIVPAARIYRTAMKAAQTDEILVPQIGMADGLIHLLYEDLKAKPTKTA